MAHYSSIRLVARVLSNGVLRGAQSAVTLVGNGVVSAFDVVATANFAELQREVAAFNEAHKSNAPPINVPSTGGATPAPGAN